MNAPARPFFQMSVKQMSKLIVFAAIASAGLAPLFRPVSDRFVSLVTTIWGLPPVLAVAALLMLRRGPLKGWLVALFLSLPVTLTMAYLEFTLVVTGVLLWRRPVPRVTSYTGTWLHIGAIVLLALGLRVFVRPFLPNRCRACCSWSAIQVFPMVMVRRIVAIETRWCFRCQSAFRRTGRGPWEPVPAEHVASLFSWRKQPAPSPGEAPRPVTETRAESHG